MTYDPRKVVSAGFPLDDVTFTYNISGAATQDNRGGAVTLDPTAPNTMKLAGEGNPIHGRLASLEDRTQQNAGVTGAVQRQFKEKLPAAIGHGIAVGDSVEGDGAVPGNVQKAAAANRTLVVEVGTDFVVVELL